MEDKYREQRQELELQLNVSALEHYDHHIFIEDLTDFAYSCHRLAVEKGFWEEQMTRLRWIARSQ